jgi:hypothetical protein
MFDRIISFIILAAVAAAILASVITRLIVAGGLHL